MVWWESGIPSSGDPETRRNMDNFPHVLRFSGCLEGLHSTTLFRILLLKCWLVKLSCKKHVECWSFQEERLRGPGLDEYIQNVMVAKSTLLPLKKKSKPIVQKPAAPFSSKKHSFHLSRSLGSKPKSHTDFCKNPWTLKSSKPGVHSTSAGHQSLAEEDYRWVSPQHSDSRLQAEIFRFSCSY